MHWRSLAFLVLTWGLCATPASAQQEQVFYYHLDAIGSVRMITDANGQVVERHDYLPFGQEWLPPPSSERRLFTGTERDSETTFDYLGARYYTYGSGRFTTVDPDHVAGDVFNPQTWNAYSYALNNPLRYVDPFGYAGDCAYGYDAKTGRCTPGLDASDLRFLLERLAQNLRTTVDDITDATWQYVRTPRDPGCMGTFMMGGAAVGAAFGGGVGVVTGPGEVATIPVGALSGAARGGVVGLGACMSSAGGGGGGGGFKSPKPGVSGKEGAKDVPSWAKGQRPRVGESGKDFAKRLLDGKYGSGNYDKGPGSEFSQLQKWGDRAFQ